MQLRQSDTLLRTRPHLGQQCVRRIPACPPPALPSSIKAIQKMLPTAEGLYVSVNLPQLGLGLLDWGFPAAAAAAAAWLAEAQHRVASAARVDLAVQEMPPGVPRPLRR